MAGQIISVIGIALIIGIIVTNPTGDKAVVNSLSTGTTSIINALEVKGG